MTNKCPKCQTIQTIPMHSTDTLLCSVCRHEYPWPLKDESTPTLRKADISRDLRGNGLKITEDNHDRYLSGDAGVLVQELFFIASVRQETTLETLQRHLRDLLYCGRIDIEGTSIELVPQYEIDRIFPDDALL